MLAKTYAEYQSEGRTPEILFWVGCAGSFDARAQKVTRAVCEILNHVGVEFAILGNEVKGGDKGKVIGGLLGGAIGAVAAQKTGTEVKLAAGTELAIALAAPVEIPR